MRIPSNLPEFRILYDGHHSSRWIVQAHLRTSDEQRKLSMACGEYSGDGSVAGGTVSMGFIGRLWY